jgi:hypothetical protein
MSVMSIRVDENQRRALKAIASFEGRTMSEIVSGLIAEYVQRQRKKISTRPETDETRALLKLSEPSFNEWDNDEDAVYDTL